MTQVSVLDARRDTSGGYKVDVGRGERIGRVSSEWFSRPDVPLSFHPAATRVLGLVTPRSVG
jgi:hypothetical protein